MTRAFVVLGLGLLVASLASPAEARPRPRVIADRIYFNGPVETLDAGFRRAHALAVAGDSILAVGDLFDVLPHLGPGTRLINLHGRALLPGFVDAHAHWLNDYDLVGLTIDESQDLALQSGVTSVANLFVNPAILENLQTVAAEGRLRLRASLYLRYDSPCGDIFGDWYLAVAPVRDPRAQLRIPGIKIFSDGGSCGLPAVTFEWSDSDPAMGDLWLDQATMNAAVAQANEHGYQVVIHAIGDRGRDVAMTAIATALGGGPNVLRHRIDHNSFVRPDQIAFFRETGIVPVGWVANTCVIESGAGLFAQVPPAAYPWFDPWRSMLAAGLPLAWHSDWPYREPSAIHHLWRLVTGREISLDDGHVCEPQDFMTAETLRVRQALRMMTLSSAYALGTEEAVGSLEPGKLADLIILDDDPLRVGADDLADIAVLSTVVGGVPRFCAPGSESLCH